MKQFLHTKQGIAVIVGALTIVLAIAALVVMNLQPESYRSIQVFDVEGAATLRREEQIVAVYKGMQLVDKDTVSQPEAGYTQLILDADKYVVLEPNTTIQLFATGKGADSNTRIHLTEGSITNHLKTSLSGNSTYEVTTPVGVMAVRGTTYRVTVLKNANGSYSSTLEVFSGAVGVKLVNPDQTLSQEVFVDAGEAAEIYGDQTVTQFVFTDQPIEYETLPISVIEQLVSWMDEGALTMGEEIQETLQELLHPIKTPAPAPSQASSLASSQAPSQASSQAPSQAPSRAPSRASSQASSLASSQESSQEPSQEPDPTPSPDPEPIYYTITFRQGSEREPGGNFARQQVRAGETATQPLLSPSASFTWYAPGSTTPYLFNTPVYADLVLYNWPS